MSRSGLAKSASREAACAEVGERARRLVGRWERGSAEVGMDSGTSADMLLMLLCVYARLGSGCVVLISVLGQEFATRRSAERTAMARNLLECAVERGVD